MSLHLPQTAETNPSSQTITNDPSIMFYFSKTHLEIAITNVPPSSLNSCHQVQVKALHLQVTISNVYYTIHHLAQVNPGNHEQMSILFP